MKIDTSKIDWSLLDKIDNPEQKAFFNEVKMNMENGVAIDPEGLVKSIGQVMGDDKSGQYEKLVDFSNNMKGLTDALKNFNR